MWVENGDIHAHGSMGVQRHLQDDLQIGEGETVRQSVVHGGHDAIIEDVGVEMNPEAGELVS